MNEQRPIPRHRIPFWNLLPFVVFLVINVILIQVYYNELERALALAKPLTLLVFGLATYRIADIIANEQVTRVMRAPFVDIKMEDGKEVEVPKRGGILKTFGALIYCPSCVGVWVAAAAVYAFVLAPTVAWVVAIAFALSALERIFTAGVGLLVRAGE